MVGMKKQRPLAQVVGAYVFFDSSQFSQRDGQELHRGNYSKVSTHHNRNWRILAQLQLFLLQLIEIELYRMPLLHSHIPSEILRSRVIDSVYRVPSVV